jgi:hypothetical protein
MRTIIPDHMKDDIPIRGRFVVPVFVPFFRMGVYLYVPKPLQGAYLDMGAQKIRPFGGVRLTRGKYLDWLALCGAQSLRGIQALAPYPVEEDFRD